MEKNKVKTERRNKIRKRIRSTIRGTAERPRLCIFKSNKHVYLQLVNDLDNATVLALSTKSASLQKQLKDKTALEASGIVGEALAKAAIEQGVTKAVFDRSGYKYHGVVKAASDGARKGGLDF